MNKTKSLFSRNLHSHGERKTIKYIYIYNAILDSGKCWKNKAQEGTEGLGGATVLRQTRCSFH